MKQTLKTPLLIFVLAALAVHFLLVFINCGPGINRQSRLFFWSQRYTYPFFQQTWQLFAPPPDANYQLIASYNHSGKQNTDVFGDVLFKHQANRLAGLEPLFLCFASSIHQFEKNALAQGFDGGRVNNNVAFNVLEKLSRAYLIRKLESQPTGIKLILVVNSTKGEPQRIYYN